MKACWEGWRRRDPARRLRDIADAHLQVAEGLIEEKSITPPNQIALRSGLRYKMPWGLLLWDLLWQDWL